MLDLPHARHLTDFRALAPLEPRLEQRAAQPYVAVEVEAPLADWTPVAALAAEVLAWVHERGIPTVGAPFLRYWIIGDRDRPSCMEVGVPVPHVVSGDDRMHPGFIHAGRYAVLVHCGHSDRIGRSRQVLEAWAAGHGVEWQMNEWDVGQEVWGGRFEFLLTDATTRPDPTQWTTEIASLVREPAA